MALPSAHHMRKETSEAMRGDISVALDLKSHPNPDLSTFRVDQEVTTSRSYLTFALEQSIDVAITDNFDVQPLGCLQTFSSTLSLGQEAELDGSLLVAQGTYIPPVTFWKCSSGT